MLPLLQGKVHRELAKANIVEILRAGGHGPDGPVPAHLLATRLGWPESAGGLVSKLVREMMADGDRPDDVVIGDEGVYLLATHDERLVFVRQLAKRLHELGRAYDRLKGQR